MNELRDLRVSKQIPVRDMVKVVRELHPKYDKTMQSKCENGEAYGVTILPDAMEVLYHRFAPERLKAPAPSRHGRHILSCRISCRLTDGDYEALQQHIRADGYTTMQNWLSETVRQYLRKKAGAAE